MRIAALSGWTSEQKHVVAASFLGWTLDAFDFFLMVFVLKDIAAGISDRRHQSHHRHPADLGDAAARSLSVRPRGGSVGTAADADG